MFPLVFLGWTMAFGLFAEAAPATAEQNPLAPLQFLVGDWEPVSKPGEGTGGFTFSMDIQGHVLVRRNHAEYPAAKDRPAAVHDDLMMIFWEEPSDALRALYCDNEGHVIRYSVETKAGNEVTFLSDVIPKAPRFRLWYKLLPTGAVAGKFEIAKPGEPEAFVKYLEWEAKRKPAAGNPPQAVAGRGHRPVIAVFAVELKYRPQEPGAVQRLSDHLDVLLAARNIPILTRPASKVRTAQDEAGKVLPAEMTLATKVAQVGPACLLAASLWDLASKVQVFTATAKSDCLEEKITESLDKVVDELVSKLLNYWKSKAPAPR